MNTVQKVVPDNAANPSCPWTNPSFDDIIFPSTGARFAMSVWQLPNYNRSVNNAARRIVWATEIAPGELLTDPKHGALLWASKCFVWAMIHPRGAESHARSGSIIVFWIHLRQLLKWMRKTDVASFGELDRSLVFKYVQHVAKRANKPVHKANLLSILLRLFDERHRMPDGHKLMFHPFGGRTPGSVVGYRESQDQEIDRIPDAIAKPLLEAAMFWVTTVSADILRLAAAIEQAKDELIARGQTNNHKHDLRSVVLKFEFSEGVRKLPWTKEVRTVTDAFNLQRDLVSACYIVIATLVGPRVHEMYSFERDCIRGPVLSEDGTLEIFYIRGMTWKRSASATGDEREWIACARPAGSNEDLAVMKAVEVLDQLGKLKNKSTSSLIFSPRSRRSPTRADLVIFLNAFLRRVELPYDWYLTTHQFRKTYARFVATSGMDAMTPLGQQLGHSRLAATEPYMGSDSDLNALLQEASAEQVAEHLVSLMKADAVGGAKGRELRPVLAKLRATIKNEAEFVSLVRTLAENTDISVYPSSWGVCYFRNESADCGGKAMPNYLHRNPTTCTGCKNLCVTEEFRPYYEWRTQDYTRLLSTYPKASKILVDDWKTSLERARAILNDLNEKQK